MVAHTPFFANGGYPVSRRIHRRILGREWET
jgi:hypothetical protein